MLAVVKPVALIAVPLEIGEDTAPIGLIKLPFAFIHVTCRVDKPTVALAHAMGPLALIHRAIRVLYRSKPMPTYLSTAQTGQVDKFALVLVPRAVDIIKLIQLVVILLLLRMLCHIGGIILLNTTHKLLFLLLHHFGLRLYAKVVYIFICGGCSIGFEIR